MVTYYLPTIRVILTLVVVSICITVMIGGFDEHLAGATHGIKAAILAIGAACILFLGMLPVGAESLAQYNMHMTRFSGALVTFFAGWEWLSHETDGKPFLYFGPVLFIFSVLATFILVGLLVSALIDIRARKKTK